MGALGSRRGPEHIQQMSDDNLISTHGGYRHLKSFQVAQLVYDVTVRFYERYAARLSDPGSSDHCFAHARPKWSGGRRSAQRTHWLS